MLPLDISVSKSYKNNRDKRKLHQERLRLAVRKKIFTEKSFQALDRDEQERSGITTPGGTYLKDMHLWYLGHWFSGSLAGAGLMVRLNQLKGHFLPKCF